MYLTSIFLNLIRLRTGASVIHRKTKIAG